MISDELIEEIKESFKVNKFINLQGIIGKPLSQFISSATINDITFNNKFNNVISDAYVVDDKEFKTAPNTIYDNTVSKSIQSSFAGMVSLYTDAELVPTYTRLYTVCKNNYFKRKEFVPNTEISLIMVSDFGANFNINNNEIELEKGDVLIIDNKHVEYEMKANEINASIDIIACNYVRISPENEQYYYDGDSNKGKVIKI